MSARTFRFAGVACALLLFATSAGAGGITVGAQYRHWAFDDGNDLRDPALLVRAGAFDAMLERWEPRVGEGQTRVEAGTFVKDSRRSAYTARWRHEAAQERIWLGTEQVAGERLVLRATSGPLLPHDGSEVRFAWECGADVYWGSYSFAGATAVRDPREGGLWSWPVRARFASERNDWVQVTVVPAAKRSFGWAIDARWRRLRGGVERNSRFDFTSRDNVILTLALEHEFGRSRD